MSISSCINTIRTSKNSLLRPTVLSLSGNVTCTREASKKTGGSSANVGGNAKPKHRGVRVQDGTFVQTGTLLAVQRTLRFHPGLNVGFGKNGTLFALQPGTVMVTCEKMNPDWTHTWITRTYSGREDQTIYKKYFHVITKPQHNRFKLLDTI